MRGGEYWRKGGESVAEYTSNGGGATHIAKVTGQLKDLSSNLSDILMVSGGGGGGLLVGETDYSGKEAGGISGSGDNSADQSTGNAFGQGESGTDVSGGGSGLYGGYKGTSSKSGGAGSGYIANSLLSNKKMVGYNVPTSSAEGTKTESINDVSASAVSGKPKSGNGFARIKFLRELITENIPSSVVNKYYMSSAWGGGDLNDSNIEQYLNTDYYIVCGDVNKARLTIDNDNMKYYNTGYNTETNHLIPLGGYKRVRNVKLKYKMVDSLNDGQYFFLHIGLQRHASDGTFEGWSTIVNEDRHSITDEISIDVDCNFVANYIRFNTCLGNLYIKDVQITY